MDNNIVLIASENSVCLNNLFIYYNVCLYDRNCMPLSRIKQ